MSDDTMNKQARRQSSLGSIFADSITHSSRRRSSIEEHVKNYYQSMEGVKKDEIVTGWDENGVAQTTALPTKRKDECLHDTLGYMLVASQLIYSFAWLRKLARESMEEKNEGWFSWMFGAQQQQKNVSLKNEELILADKGEGEEVNAVRYLKKDVHATDVNKFIEDNLPLFDEHGETSEDEARELLETLEACKGVDQYLAEFDDKFADKECVYAIVVNRQDQRVIVVFRGSVTGEDWQTNFNAWLGNIDRPQRVKDLGFDKEIKIHSGFRSYLFDETLEGDESRPRQKFDDVIDDLKRIYTQERYAKYDLFITGHSLGGGLSSLLGFKIAGSKRYSFLPKTTTVVSFAAPKVGDDRYNEAYQLLEQEGFLRSVRVSNQGDVVPVAPPSAWPFLHSFTQTGVNLHLQTEGTMEVGHRNLKYFLSQSSTGAVQNHTLAEYHARLRLEANVDFLFGNTIEDLYMEDISGFKKK